MTPQQKQNMIPGPYSIDHPTMDVYSVRGENGLQVMKSAASIVNRNGQTHRSTKENAEAACALFNEAIQVLVRTGKSPYELEREIQQLREKSTNP